MSDDFFSPFGDQADRKPEGAEPDEDSFLAALRGAAADDDDLFTPVEPAPVEEEEDLFSILPEEEELEPAPAEEPDLERRPEWVDTMLAGYGGEQFAEEEAAPAPASRPQRPGPLSRAIETGGPVGALATRGLLFGLTPQQRMILSIFLFIDVSLVSCLMLIMIGAIRF
ncbi:MAG: hypothetical protein Kow00124_21120 [Anaerolineae bacterium]